MHVRNRRRPARHRAQSGVVLLIAIVVLVAMTLAAIGLMRSVFTGNRVAGNLAFQQSATQSADQGIATAVRWLENVNNTNQTALYNAIAASGGANPNYAYSPIRQDPTTGTSWDTFWTTTLAGAGLVNTLAADQAGNTVSVVIQRLCQSTGSPSSGAGCAVSPTVTGTESSSKGSGVIPLQVANQVYYRITARVAGPRNTVSYVQAVVAM